MVHFLIHRVIEQVFPCFIRAPSDSNAKPVDQLYTGNAQSAWFSPWTLTSPVTHTNHDPSVPDEGYKSIQLDLERSPTGSEDIQEWWIVDQPSAAKIQMRAESKLEKKREAGLQLYVFSDKVSPPSLGFLAGYGWVTGYRPRHLWACSHHRFHFLIFFFFFKWQILWLHHIDHLMQC